jgi:hypothetical protein
VDETLHPLGITLWNTARFPTLKGPTVLDDPIPTLAKHYIAYGHVVSFRTSLRDYILPFPKTFAVRKFFDVWVALVLASVADVACIPQPLVLHRIHSGQIAGIATLVSLRERIARRRSGEKDKTAQFVPLVEEVISRVSTLTDASPARQNLEKLIRWAEHMKMYLQLPARRHSRFLPITHALLTGQYHLYARGFLTAARDLLILQ